MIHFQRRTFPRIVIEAARVSSTLRVPIFASDRRAISDPGQICGKLCFYHAPLPGATVLSVLYATLARQFQSTPARRDGWVSAVLLYSTRFQSACPSRARLLNPTPPDQVAGVSMHALMQGATGGFPYSSAPSRFQSTRPRGARRLCTPSPVHPRVRGEHYFAGTSISGRVGSSPRTRGTPDSQSQMRLCLRFIPAHAGNTGRCTGAAIPAPVHPRARGEHPVATSIIIAEDGSSPRTRGTRARSRPCTRYGRFIPAHAGNTTPWWRQTATHAVHPRARGEHAMSPALTNRWNGSSPRTRGTRATPERLSGEGRFIPAHAGNTPRRR